MQNLHSMTTFFGPLPQRLQLVQSVQLGEGKHHVFDRLGISVVALYATVGLMGIEWSTLVVLVSL